MRERGNWRSLAAGAGVFFVVGALWALNPTWSVARDAGLAPTGLPKGATVLFNGQETAAWVRRGGDQPIRWKVVDGALVAGGGDIATKEKYGDFQLHLEWMEPDLPDRRGQSKGNSGIGLQGRYEIQLLDSFGWATPGTGDCGAVYHQAAPLVNACKPPLQWQSMEIIFRGARADEQGKVVTKPRVTVIQNGIVVQNNTEIQGPTGIEDSDTSTSRPGAIVLQDHGNPLQFRNIWILPLPERGSDQYDPR